MKDKKSKILALVAIVVVVASIGAYVYTSQQGTESTTKLETRTMTDMAGRTVEIPAEVNRVVTLFPPANQMVYTIAPDKLQKKLGIPVICITPRHSIEENKESFNLIGEVLGEEDRAEELVSYYDEKMEYLTDKTSNIPRNEKLSVYFAGGGPMGGSMLTTAGKDFIINEDIKIAGGINVAENLTGSALPFAEVPMEQIILWNPDVIIKGRVTRGSDMQSDPRWQGIKAVKDERVYEIPSYVHEWGYPTPEWIMGTMWLADKLYPKTANLNMINETKEFYSKFYHYNLTEEEVSEILNPK